MQKKNSDKTTQDNNYFATDTTLLAQMRTKLATERTFLSWIRTGLACVAGGIGIIKFINFHEDNHQLAAKISGNFLILIGIIFFIFSLINYLNIKHILPDIAGFKETSTTIVTLAVLILILLSFVFLFII